MKKHIKFKKIFFCLLLILLIGCREEKSFEAVKKECSSTEIIYDIGILLTGFTFDEIDTILVKVYDNKKEIDSFYINTDKSTYDPMRQKYGASLHRKININNTFYFYIKGEKNPYVLSNMKMIVTPCVSMLEKNSCCFMRQFDLDGKTYYEANPELRKRTQ